MLESYILWFNISSEISFQIRCFFEETDENTSKYFVGTKIWSKEKYRSEQGKYPVISLSFKDVKYDSWSDTCANLYFKIQAETALFFENIYDEFGDSADFQFLMGLIYMNNARFEDAVREFLKAVKHKECRNKGTNSYAAFYNVGVIYECLGKEKKAREYYRKCGDYEPAKKRLAACL